MEGSVRRSVVVGRGGAVAHLDLRKPHIGTTISPDPRDGQSRRSCPEESIGRLGIFASGRADSGSLMLEVVGVGRVVAGRDLQVQTVS
jgi:hypothetical protein